MLVKKMLKSKMGGQNVPDEELDKIIELVEKNPELFQKIGNEIQAKMKAGKDQMTATMEVMQAHKNELQKLNQNPS